MVSAVLGDALSIYRRLLRRSAVVAGAVFAVVGLAQALAERRPSTGTLLVALMLGLIGSLLVQGALVEVVRDLHDGKRVGRAAEYYDRTRGRLGTLIGATVLYGVGVAVGFVLLIVPGLILMARWSLVVPLVMIEGRGVREAFGRSSELVRGQTGRVLVLVLVASVLTSLASTMLTIAFLFLPAFGAAWLGSLVAGALAVPYQAHVLTVLYYRLTEPERPILPAPGDERWRSIWDEGRDEGAE